MIEQKNEQILIGWWSWNILFYKVVVDYINNGWTGILFIVMNVESYILLKEYIFQDTKYIKNIKRFFVGFHYKYTKNIVHTSLNFLINCILFIVPIENVSFISPLPIKGWKIEAYNFWEWMLLYHVIAVLPLGIG